MEKEKTYQVKIAATILLLLAKVASLLAGTVYYVNDGESFKECIYPPSETLPPNTHVIINVSSYSITLAE